LLAMNPHNAPSSGFIDVPDNHWARDAINLTTQLSWMQGRGGGVFAPDENITRAEFSTLINRIIDRTTPESIGIYDYEWRYTWADNMNPAMWFYIAMQIASNPSPNAPPMNWAALHLPYAVPMDVFVY